MGFELIRRLREWDSFKKGWRVQAAGLIDGASRFTFITLKTIILWEKEQQSAVWRPRKLHECRNPARLRSSPGGTLTRISSVAGGMKGNPNFVDAKPTAEEYETGNIRLNKALAASKKFRSPLAKQETEDAQKACIELLDSGAIYVAQKCAGNATMAETSGFILKKSKRRTYTPAPDQATIKFIERSSFPGCVVMAVAPLGRGVRYVLEVSTDNQETWSFVELDTDSKNIFVKKPAEEKNLVGSLGRTTGGDGASSVPVCWIGGASPVVHSLSGDEC